VNNLVLVDYNNTLDREDVAPNQEMDSNVEWEPTSLVTPLQGQYFFCRTSALSPISVRYAEEHEIYSRVSLRRRVLSHNNSRASASLVENVPVQKKQTSKRPARGNHYNACPIYTHFTPAWNKNHSTSPLTTSQLSCPASPFCSLVPTAPVKAISVLSSTKQPISLHSRWPAAGCPPVCSSIKLIHFAAPQTRRSASGARPHFSSTASSHRLSLSVRLTLLRAGEYVGGTTTPRWRRFGSHPNSYASMVTDPASLHTAPATLRALRGDELLPMLVRKLTESWPYGAGVDKGNGSFSVDLQEKLARYASESQLHDLWCRLLGWCTAGL